MIASTADNSCLQMPVLQHVFVSRESQRRIAIGATILAESGGRAKHRAAHTHKREIGSDQQKCGAKPNARRGADALRARVSLLKNTEKNEKLRHAIRETLSVLEFVFNRKLF